MDNKILVTRSSMPSLDEYVEEIRPIWESHWLTNMGAKHKQLQAELEGCLGVPHVALYTNGHLALENAIAALQYKDADYTKVDAAITKANALKKDDYKDFSGVETAVKAVVRGKNITEQSEVDKMAKAIEDAIAALEKKPASTKPGTSDKSPQTGDTSNLALWIALLFISGGAAIGTTIVSRKKKYNR